MTRAAEIWANGISRDLNDNSTNKLRGVIDTTKVQMPVVDAAPAAAAAKPAAKAPAPSPKPDRPITALLIVSSKPGAIRAFSCSVPCLYVARNFCLRLCRHVLKEIVMTAYDYDLFVIGGGSGGVRAGRVAASLGKRVGIAEEFRYGGTCVIRGCVPKKLYVYASQFSEHFEDAEGYGWTVGERSFDWKKLVAAKEKEITRLEGLYRRGLENNKAEVFDSRAELVDAHTVRLVASDKTVTAERIVIATGGVANAHISLPGYQHCISSNEAFDLEELPRSMLIAGGGYIAVEFANIFHGLGVDVTLIYRGKEILSRFDHDMRQGLHKAMVEKGVRILTTDVIESVEKRAEGDLVARTKNGETITADQVMLALGRDPNTKGLGLEKAGVAVDHAGAIIVDDFRARARRISLRSATSPTGYS